MIPNPMMWQDWLMLALWTYVYLPILPILIYAVLIGYVILTPRLSIADRSEGESAGFPRNGLGPRRSLPPPSRSPG